MKNYVRIIAGFLALALGIAPLLAAPVKTGVTQQQKTANQKSLDKLVAELKALERARRAELKAPSASQPDQSQSVASYGRSVLNLPVLLDKQALSLYEQKIQDIPQFEQYVAIHLAAIVIQNAGHVLAKKMTKDVIEDLWNNFEKEFKGGNEDPIEFENDEELPPLEKPVEEPKAGTPAVAKPVVVTPAASPSSDNVKSLTQAQKDILKQYAKAVVMGVVVSGQEIIHILKDGPSVEQKKLIDAYESMRNQKTLSPDLIIPVIGGKQLFGQVLTQLFGQKDTDLIEKQITEVANVVYNLPIVFSTTTDQDTRTKALTQAQEVMNKTIKLFASHDLMITGSKAWTDALALIRDVDRFEALREQVVQILKALDIPVSAAQQCSITAPAQTKPVETKAWYSRLGSMLWNNKLKTLGAVLALGLLPAVLGAANTSTASTAATTAAAQAGEAVGWGSWLKKLGLGIVQNLGISWGAEKLKPLILPEQEKTPEDSNTAASESKDPGVPTWA